MGDIVFDTARTNWMCMSTAKKAMGTKTVLLPRSHGVKMPTLRMISSIDNLKALLNNNNRKCGRLRTLWHMVCGRVEKWHESLLFDPVGRSIREL